MDPTTIVFVVLLLLSVVANAFLRQWIVVGAARNTIRRIYRSGAVSPETAQTAGVLGLRTKRTLGFRNREFVALRHLMQEGFVRVTEDGQRYYLSERLSEIDPKLLR